MSDKGQQAAIITGGSPGIGASLVTAYHRQGWSVVATARTMKPAATASYCAAVVPGTSTKNEQGPR